MLILPMLPGSTSSPVSPSKYSSPATDTERAGQATDTSGFGAILAHEMNEKDDISDARSAKGEKALSSVPRGLPTPADTTVTAEELQGANGEISKDNSETGSNTAIAVTGLQPMDLANILPGLPTAGVAEVRIDTEALDRSDIGSNRSTVILPRAPQVDFTGTAPQSTDVAPLQQDLVAGYTALTEVDTVPDLATVAVGGKASQIQTSAEAQIKLALAKETQAIATENSTGSELESRQRLPQPTAFTFSKFSLANEIEKAGNEKAGTPVLEQAPDLLTAALPSTLASPPTASVSAEHPSALVAGSAVANNVLRLEPRIGATGWDNALSQKVLWMVSDGRQIAELNLNPPDLGPLQVVLSITDDQASATFISQHADVRNALEAALPRLKEMMAESGLQLSNTTVSSDSPQQQKGFERHASVRHNGEGGHMLASDVDISGSHIRSGGSSLVDTFA
jgi:flagellar hook-length control protein FliK